MQRFIATIMMFFLAAVSVLPGMDVHEAEKLPDLIRHYRHHLAEAPSSEMTFLEFMALHYGAGRTGHKEQEHESLPLKSHASPCPGHFVTVDDVPTVSFAVPAALPTDTIERPAPLPRSTPSSIFQPPRA
ncbi:MAG: hypothetical protein J0I17_06315 ['Candidatus Kapabacteria' thiocyanatum]|uniref:Uncharacterized protein n=1 Tax=Candidatus Kapaibacterium thiocyanatum TaxID=1895771 RepID=A0A1M3L6J6_9BACT|nr:hypothetical protein ['Candidatus Kapabacteria' thiocyanatum]OJX61186.1 MAG: hypothetical protein BGO89_00940 ['Candidatus Kapabacteria' thiocyanatum]